MLVDEWHRVAQERLQTAAGAAAEQALLRITLDRAAHVMGAYATGISRLLGGGQLAAGQLGLAYMAAFMPPRRPPDLRHALAPVAVTPDSPQSTAGLARLWRLLDEDVPEAEARESAAFYGSGVAVGNLQQAERLGMDEGAAAAEQDGVVRYRLHPNPGACEWCLFIADTGARYLTAESVPVPHSPSNPKQKGGVCRCSPAVGEEGEVLMREMEGAGEGELEPVSPEEETGEPISEYKPTGDWAADRDQIRRLDTKDWFDSAEDTAAHRAQLDQMQSVGTSIEDEAMRRWQATQDADPVFYPQSVQLRADLRREVLGEIRPMGGELNVDIPRNKGQLGKAMNYGQRYYPKEWIDSINESGSGEPWKVTKVRRGFFDSGRRQISISPNWPGLTPEQAGAEVATHEIGHGAQYTRSQLRNSERLLHQRRTTLPDGTRPRTVAMYPGSRERSSEDKYPQRYSGREYTYGVGSEVLTTSAQSVFSPAATEVGRERGAQVPYYADDEMTRWLLGAMAKL